MSDTFSSTNIYPFLCENGFLGSGVVGTERKTWHKDALLVEPSVCALLVPQNVPCKYQLESIIQALPLFWKDKTCISKEEYMLSEVASGVAKVSCVVDAWPGRAHYLAREDVEEMSEALSLLLERAGVLRKHQTWAMGCATSSVPANSTHCSRGI